MRRIAFALFLLMAVVSTSFSQSVPNITGDWDGPNDLILHFTYNPTSKNVKVDYCGIYRVMEWNPTARIENGNLILTQDNQDGSSFSGRLHIDSSNKMTGNINMIGYGESYFEGATSLTRSSKPYYEEIMGMPGNNPDLDTSYSGGQPSDYELTYSPLSDEVVKPIPQVPESVWKKNWKLVYGKDRFGVEDKSSPQLVAAGNDEASVFIITPTKGIFVIIPDMKFKITNYDNYTLYVKSKTMGQCEFNLTQLDKTIFQFTGTEDNYKMLDVLDAGNFKMALKMSDSLMGEAILNADITNETIGVIPAMEYYFMDIPGFQDAWQFYGD